MKSVVICTLTAVFFLSALAPGLVREAHAFDPLSAASLVYGGYQGVTKIMGAAGVSWTKARWAFSGMPHTWWGVSTRMAPLHGTTSGRTAPRARSWRTTLARPKATATR